MVEASAWRSPALAVLWIGSILALAAISIAARLACARLKRCCRLARDSTGNVLGVLLVCAVAVLWTASSVAVQVVFEDVHYRKPFCLTYFCSTMLVVYLPFYPRQLRQIAAFLHCSACAPSSVGPTRYGILGSAPNDGSQPPEHTLEFEGMAAGGGMAVGAVLQLAAELGSLFFIFNYCFNIGLEMTTVSASSVISTSSCLWTLAFSACLLKERISCIKLIAVLLTFCGVCIVVLSDERNHLPPSPLTSSPLAGDAITLLSAVLYGAYATRLKLKVPSELALPMPFLFGLMGLINACLFLPFIGILQHLRIESFVLPQRSALLVMTSNALLGTVAANMLLARAMLLASPLVATVGLSLSIPLAMLSDAARGRAQLSFGLLLGGCCVWTGFIMVSGSATIEERIARLQASRRG
ncbi:hypothetical protein AB1Y20_022565 [Prymnesium parvum]|uniref:EamA domain-containing protein n=1 Tax=Prymnesium parvum TaxID=97485 RepID=A0AB34JJ81_PRYPA